MMDALIKARAAGMGVGKSQRGGKTMNIWATYDVPWHCLPVSSEDSP